MELKENCYIIYFWNEEEEAIVKMHAVETHVRKIYMRIFAAIREGLKLIDLYRVNDTVKKWSKSYFRETVEKDIIQMKLIDMIEAHSKGKTKRIDEFLRDKIRERIKNDPLERN